MVKALLALEVRNNPDWLLILLTLEAFAFSARIYFLDLVVFWPFSWPLQLFYAGSFSPLFQFSTWIFLKPYSLFSIPTEAAGPVAEVVFSMKMSRVASLQGP